MRLSLRDKLIIASLIVILPIIVWTVVAQILNLRESRRRAIAEQSRAAMTLAGSATDYVADLLDTAKAAGALVIGPYEIAPDELSRYLSKMAESNAKLCHIGVTNAKGIMIAGDMPEMIGVDISGFPAVRRVMRGEEWTVSRVFRSRLLEKPVFAINFGIRDERGRLAGMVSAMSEGDVLQDAIRHDLRWLDKVVITDAAGNIILTHGISVATVRRLDWSRLPFIRKALAGSPSIVEDFELPDGTMVLGAVRPVEAPGWTVGVFRSVDDAVGREYRDAMLYGVSGIALIWMAIGIAAYMGSRLAKPVLDLADTACVLAQGQLGARVDVYTGDELELLGKSFNDMAAALQQRTAELNTVVAAVRREAEKSLALYSVAQGLVVTVDLNERLEIIARALASICGVTRSSVFLKRGTRLVPTAGWGMYPPETWQDVAVEVGAGGVVHEALAPGQPVLVPDAAKDPRVDQMLITRFNVKGFLVLPLVRREHVIGVAVLDTPGEYPRFDPETINAARGMAELAAIAIENAETFEKWLRIAQTLQKGMLPTVPERIGSFSIASRYYAAMEMAELGGDFYDAITLPDGRIGLVIADVSGKGLEAAVFTAMGKYTLRAYVAEDAAPGCALTRTNRALTQIGGDWGFVTMFYGLLNLQTGRLVYASAGHPPSLLLNGSGELKWLPFGDTQPPIGIMGGLEYRQDECLLDVGDILVCYTDGAIEARRDDEQFQVERLAGVVKSCSHLSPGEIADAVHSAVVEFSRGRIQDDIALLVIKREEV